MNNHGDRIRAIWIGGWATNLVCWKLEFESLFPNWHHEFWDSLQPDNVKQDLQKLVSMKSSERIFVFAWSLGSLVLHDWLVSRSEIPSGNIIFASINPVFDFCAAQDGWSPRILEKMKKKLSLENNTVTSDFFQSMIKNVDLTNQQLEQWNKFHIAGHNFHQLKDGLAYLAEKRVDMQAFLKRYPNQIFFMDNQDPISPVLDFSKNDGDVNVVQVNSHVPFLVESEKIKNYMEVI